ncbi:bromodomain-containing protein 7 isoform X2 [Anthonomus grandis grandis]|uniref:bromodomain-containing protein 7 isoform X2 n=1 Tax=Anthonomus grandis grandis TaxID=2921223 RepID=UPI002165A6E6|nr:bromodomain-containing protein 7 isoform X2 [Anthonomus grandis grandis]
MERQVQNTLTHSAPNPFPKKHKKHKKEREEKDDKPQLKLILKAMSEKYACVGSNNPTPEHDEELGQQIMMAEGDEHTIILDPSDPAYALHRAHHKKSKKKKKKKDKNKDRDRDRERRHKHHHKDKKRKRDEMEDEDLETSSGGFPLLGSPSNAREPRTCVIKKIQEKAPLAKALDQLLTLLEKKDPQNFFAWPVTDAFAPGYSKIISKPMDFSTMRQKIEENQYNHLKEFTEDFHLMCDNAMKYNHTDTVYYKASKKLLLAGQKILQPEKLGWLLQVSPELTEAELGFEVTAEMRASAGRPEDTDGCVKVEAKEPPTSEEVVFNKKIFGGFLRYSFQILAQAKAAARHARARLKGYGPSMGYLRPRRDGSAQLSILVGNNLGKKKGVAPLGSIVGRLSDGTAHLQGFREDKRNAIRSVKPLYYGAFGSYAPSYDSAFSNLTKEESALILRTYGSDQGVQYAESIQDFVKGCDYAERLVDSLLDLLTGGDHSKTKTTLDDNKKLKDEEEAVRTVLETPKVDKVKVNVDDLKSLKDIGIDVNFLEGMEEDLKKAEDQQEMQKKLNDMCQLLEKLQKTQYERLSQPPPINLHNIPGPTKEEHHIANECVEGLAEITKKVTPAAVAPVPAIRRALGVPVVPVPDPEPDLEMELRQFLEQAQQPAHMETDNAIEEILME